MREGQRDRGIEGQGDRGTEGQRERDRNAQCQSHKDSKLYPELILNYKTLRIILTSNP
jgi:hypothetical protein